MSQSITRHDYVRPSAQAEPASVAAAPAPPDAPTSRWQWLRNAASTLAVLGALAGLAVWGQSTDWTLPKFSTLLGRDADAPKDWCSDHNVPESQCIECNGKLLAADKDYGWCEEHGVAQCPFEHPEVIQLSVAPEVTREDLEQARRALATRPRIENNSRCKLYARRVQFASAQAMEKAGVDIAVVGRSPMIEAISANGEVIYDETHSAHLASRVAGTVWRVERQVGDQVRKGDILALVDSADVGKAKEELLQAITQQRLKATNVERLRPLADEQAIPGRQFREAQAALEEADIRLLGAQQSLNNLGFKIADKDFADLDVKEVAKRIRYLGLPETLVNKIESDSPTSNLFPIRAPLDGVVVACKTVAGEVVDTSTTLYAVADTRRMWLMLDVRQDDTRFLELGATVLFRATEGQESDARGKIAWISTEANDQTRTVKVRANLPNVDGRLRANTFGAGRIVLREEPRAIVVPSEAIHSDGECQIVFVRDKNFLKPDAPKFFHVRQVRVGVDDGERCEVIAGVLPGEVIASKNSVVLEAQLLKSKLGAGCGCCEPK